MRKTPFFCAILALLASSTPAPAQATQPVPYLQQLQDSLRHSRQRAADLSASAQDAAGRICSAHGHLFVAPDSQPDAADEIVERAGGLMGIRALRDQKISTNDVILFPIRAAASKADEARIDQWKSTRALVVPIHNQGRTDTVANLIDLWTWTGEFAAACTRLGKMPVFYQSYHLPGGRERAARYQGKFFHNDFTLPPIKGGELSRQYLNAIEATLKRIAAQSKEITTAADWLRTSKTKPRAYITAHIAPGHFADSRFPQPFDLHRALFNDKIDAGPDDVILLLWYQHPPDQLQPLLNHGAKVIYSSVLNGPATNATNTIYIDPAFPITDGAVKLDGYDVPILPTSAIAQAAIYWSILQSMQPSP